MTEHADPQTRRLSLAALDTLPPVVRRPAMDPRHVRAGIVHLGIGAFHRAHQAVFTEDAAEATDRDDWGIVGVTQRSSTVRDQLAPQDGLYTLLERGPGAASPRVVGAIREVLYAGGDPAAVVARLAAPEVRVVTLTVTEKGYLRGAGGRLDLAAPAVRRDLTGSPPATVAGQLARGLQARQRRGSGPVTVVCCDNLTDNGAALRDLVEDFCRELPSAEGTDLLAWLAGMVRFPSTMVDRIVPAATDRDREAVHHLLGLSDHGVVVAEPFRQWVLTDDFAADRPGWELAGAVLTSDVRPWETAKLRLLNASHSLLAYLGALRGHETIAEALTDDELGLAAEMLMRQDVLPTLAQPDGLDLHDYSAQVLRRFANPDLRHSTRQVAMDGSQKLPERVLGTIRDRLAAGVLPERAVLVVAAWMAYVERAARPGSALPLEDPMADRLGAVAASAGGDLRRLVDGLLGIEEVFGADFAAHGSLGGLLTEQVGCLLGEARQGVG